MKRERLFRDTAAVQSLVMLALFVSAGLPWRYGRNIFEELGRNTTSGILATLHFGMPLVAAAITLSRLLRGRVPQRGSFWLLASQEIFKTLAAVLAAFALISKMHRHRPEEMFAIGGIFLLAGLVAVALVRGARREGWERWAHLLAMMTPWHLFASAGLLAEMGSKHPEKGPWMYLFCAATLLPLMLWTLWPRRLADEPAPTAAPPAG